MKALLPFDDFVLNRNENTRRIFKQPKWLFDQAFSDSCTPVSYTHLIPLSEHLLFQYR